MQSSLCEGDQKEENILASTFSELQNKSQLLLELVMCIYLLITGLTYSMVLI